MGDIADAFDNAFRDYVNVGIPASGKHEVEKSDARALGVLIDGKLDLLEAGQQSGAKLFETWPQLAASPGTEAGEAGEVIYTAAGTHTDPVAGGTVPNAGRYRWSTSPAGWLRVGDNTVTSKADKATAVSGAGLVTGGGDLSASRTLTVAAATAGDVTAGTATDKAVTPAAVRPALDALDARADDLDAALPSKSVSAAARFVGNLQYGKQYVVGLLDKQFWAVSPHPKWCDLATRFISRSRPLSGRYVSVFEVGGQSLLAIDRTTKKVVGPIVAAAAAQAVARTTAQLASYEPRRLATGALPTKTDDRSLHRYRLKRAQVLSGIAGATLKVAVGLDSWGDITAIPAAIRKRFTDKGYPIGGPGFRGVEQDAYVFAGAFSRSGWTFVDGSSTTSFPYGVGIDGKCIWTNGTAATASWTTASPATTINIHTMGFGGTWRWRVDGGAWTSVTSPNDSAFHVVAIPGLADTVHTLDIDTTGNTAVVSIVGLDGVRSAGGLIVHKIGNGGLSMQRMMNWISYVAAPAAHLGIDLVIGFTGTNDSRYGDSTAETYASRHQTMVTTWRSGVGMSDVGFILAAPPQHGSAEVVPLSTLVLSQYAWARDNGHSWVNCWSTWPSYADALAQGLWDGTVHLSNSDGGPTDPYRAGPAMIAAQVDQAFSLS